MPQLLLEILSEEIPARMQAQAAKDLERLAREKLIAEGLLPEAVKTFAGSRRLTLVAEGLPVAQADRKEELKGPKVGAPDQAMEGFLRKTGLTRDQLVERDGVWFANLDKPGRPTAEIVAEMVEAIIRGFPWPKSMVSGVSKLRWVRPLRGLLCVFDREIVPINIEGLESGETTVGHRFMGQGEKGSGKPIRARDFDEYAAGLEREHVVLDVEERKARIVEAAKTLCFARNLDLVEDAGLLDEVAGLVEWPVPVLGDMDAGFLDLPPEVIRTSMRVHQRYFAVRDPKTGNLAPHFITVANIAATDGGRTIALGNAKVLSARLSDARFFWNEDRKVRLEDRLEKLKGVTFHAKLGTMYQRVERITALAGELAAYVDGRPLAGEVLGVNARLAARLCKADLGTGVVGEFPELQGIMGGYYAEHEGLNPHIVEAIRSHYRPQGPNDAVPMDKVAITVALADKLDMLASFFGIDEKPTGSRDPFALRRAALGIIRILAENNVRLSLRRALRFAALQSLLSIGDDFIEEFEEHLRSVRSDRIEDALAMLPAPVWRLIDIDGLLEDLDTARGPTWVLEDMDADFAGAMSTLRGRLSALRQLMVGAQFNGADALARDLWADPDRIPDWLQTGLLRNSEEVLQFLMDRLTTQLRDAGQRHDLVAAVVVKGDDDIVRILARVKALDSFLATEDGANLLAGYKRAVNILKAEEKKGPLPTGAPEAMPAAPAEEQALVAAVRAAEARLDGLIAAEDFAGAMSELAKLRGPVDAFFDKVLVNSDVAAERDNRLRLLATVRDAMGMVADFSQVTG